MGLKLNFLFQTTASLACISLAYAQNLYAADSVPTPRYSIRQDTPDTGSNIKRNAVSGSRVPFEKRYEELTAAEKQIIKSQYEKMADDDEPPFPLYGLSSIYKSIYRGQQRLLVSGEIDIHLEIDEKGEPESAKVFQTPSQETAQFVASVLMLTKFKPAKCSGVPCKMSYPFSMIFQVN
jgi:hypothetical protein